ncbi:PP2C family protein-serine/threonine phosphatase [Alkalicoccobacillus porphyridii]|uniref:PP2C family protein-serine/threonine phosphatase n=1 Tax=Alkalicoccobacillus porphyridii TaxID=2597270 RepID=A0A554A1L5_9BACI|nr:PP2C family protein-serine/threonine phosphatase [Alkalicoccobacillus porphyridii]TSB47590.1 PP2C family protein-serine/threonine phosphatase [Alkalicoccobacillus porphyridii]
MKDTPKTDHSFHIKNIDLNETLQREINLAQTIQMTLLNGDNPSFESGELSGLSLPARLIGGDYYDFYKLKNGCIRIVIGDVMGKGIPAAMLMILTRGAFRSASENTATPGATLTSMNQALYKDLRKLKSFVTLFCADLDPRTGVLTYSSAGHNLPLHVHNKANTVTELPKVKGIMLGGLPDQNYGERQIQLDKLDVVLFYTDGLIDAHNNMNEFFSLATLKEVALKQKDHSALIMQTEIMNSVHQFINNIPQKDDITIVILKLSNNL